MTDLEYRRHPMLTMPSGSRAYLVIRRPSSPRTSRPLFSMPGPYARTRPHRISRSQVFLLMGRPSRHLADLMQLVLQTQSIERVNGQGGEDADALKQHAIGILESERDLGRATLRRCRIGNAPMGRHRLSRPEGARFPGRVVADREHEIERGRAGLGELAPRFRPEAGRVVAEAPQQRDRLRMHLALGLASGTVGGE